MNHTPETRQRIAVLGSTGSVGISTLDVIARHPDRFEVFALSASTKVDELLAQCLRFRPQFAVMASAPHAARLAQQLEGQGLRGIEGERTRCSIDFDAQWESSGREVRRDGKVERCRCRGRADRAFVDRQRVVADVERRLLGLSDARRKLERQG